VKKWINNSEVSLQVFWSSIRKKTTWKLSKSIEQHTRVHNFLLLWRSFLISDDIRGEEGIVCCPCRKSAASEFVKTSVENSTSVQKEIGPSVVLKVSFILTLDVKFILMD